MKYFMAYVGLSVALVLGACTTIQDLLDAVTAFEESMNQDNPDGEMPK